MRNKGGFLIASVIILVFIGLLVITSSMNVFTMFMKNDEIHSINSIANTKLTQQVQSFKNVLMYSNSDGDWYKTEWFDRRDINNDDDDYNWSIHWTDWVYDDDWDAFKSLFGTIIPDKEENVLFFDNKYKEFSQLSYNILTNIKIFSDRSAKYELIIFDWNTYENEKMFIDKKRISWDLFPWDTMLRLDTLWLSYWDILAIYIQNTSTDILSYRVSWVWTDWNELLKFAPFADNGRNYDYYSSVLLKDKDWAFIQFSRTYYNILNEWKRPIAPSALRAVSTASWILSLEWQINEFTVTWSILLYQWIDSTVWCQNQYFYKALPYWENTYTWKLDYWNYYYTLCQSNKTVTWSGFLDDKWYLSTMSNVINVNENQ